jgi:hypothetical protein
VIEKKRKKQKKVTKPRKKGEIMAGGAPTPCKIARVDPGVFQINATDTPVTLQLCEDTQGNPASTSTINEVDVRQVGTSDPVKNQPTGLTKTKFTLTLPAAKYVIRLVITPQPGCKYAFLYEACSKPQFWLLALDAVEPDGPFTLIVT